ncbi:MAG: transglycosylase SLT domain-containing protein, partial [Bacteroidetes bacterium]|nr:transglycosylase SLT domain-containing protein [Bacteroidota bacterium]
YTQRWDTLPQAKFWQMVMGMRRDSCIVNVSSSRRIVEVKASYWWESLTDSLQNRYKDSIRQALHLGEDEGIYITAGKRHYYAFDKVLHSISEGVAVFEQKGVDPWYAQAILLIESPGKLQYSPVGAYGSFQLMEDVAREHGLIVNDSIDEREDFPKAAGAAADLIASRCIPQTRHMLRKRGITFDEKQLWFRLLVLHSYHAGAGNVDGVLEIIKPTEGGQELMKRVWTTEYKGFKNASQNYSQVALASILKLDEILSALPDSVCRDSIVIM